MTRGTLYLINSQKDYTTLYQTCEFNGDMYEGGHYEEAVERLLRVEHPADFYKESLAFDEKNFQYQDEKNGYFNFKRNNIFVGTDKPKQEKYVSIHEATGDMEIDLSVDYYEYWFSDYLFFKVTGTRPVVFKTADGKQQMAVAPGNVVTFNFGNDMKIIDDTSIIS